MSLQVLTKRVFRPKFIISWLVVLLIVYFLVNGFLLNSVGSGDSDKKDLPHQLVRKASLFKISHM